MLRTVSALAALSASRSSVVWRRLLSPATQVEPMKRWKRSATTEAFNKNLPRTLEIRNGEKVKGTFSTGEMDRRINNLRKYMADNDISASVLTSYHNINYFGDFLFCSFGRLFAIVVTLDKNILVAPKVDGGLPWRRCHDDHLIYTDWHKGNFFYAISEILKDSKGKIGVEYDEFAIENFRKLEQSLPGRSIIDVGVPTMEMRLIKSAEEIELITQGARICDVGGWACVEALDEGVSEYKVALAGTEAMVEEIANTYPHTEIRDTWAWAQSGGVNSDGCHNYPTTKTIQKGEVVIINCFPMIAGYYTALERTVFFDNVPSDRHLELWEINCDVHRRGVELIQPGARCDEITAELNDMYKKHNLLQYRSFGYGHSFGTMSHYYGREAGMEFREDVDTVLQPGMVVSMEPMIMIPEGMEGAGGYREHDIVVVTEDKGVNITKFPFGPDHLIVKK